MRALAWFGAVLGVSLYATTSSAHVRIDYPTARHEEDFLKEGPCGKVGDSRTGDQSRVTVLKPGQKLVVKFTETINHDGHFRIAFDDNGQDAFKDPTSFTDIQKQPQLPILLDGIADKEGGAYTAEVILPDIECDRCTLQLIQVMQDDSAFSAKDDIYYQCSDIVLSNDAVNPPAGEAGGTSTGVGGSSGSGTGSGEGTASHGGTKSGTGGGTSSTRGGSGSGTTKGPGRGSAQSVDASDPVAEPGCTCRLASVPNTESAEGVGLLALVVALALRRQRFNLREPHTF